MEGRWTKVSTIVAILALAIGLWQLIPKPKPNYSGEWKMTVFVRSAKWHKYIGEQYEWRIYIVQTDDKISGTGEKVSINSNPLDYKLRTSLILDGKIDGPEFLITYIEKGLIRETKGIFKGQFEKDKFKGEFEQTASDAKGEIAGVKLK